MHKNKLFVIGLFIITNTFQLQADDQSKKQNFTAPLLFALAAGGYQSYLAWKNSQNQEIFQAQRSAKQQLETTPISNSQNQQSNPANQQSNPANQQSNFVAPIISSGPSSNIIAEPSPLPPAHLAQTILLLKNEPEFNFYRTSNQLETNINQQKSLLTPLPQASFDKQLDKKNRDDALLLIDRYYRENNLDAILTELTKVIDTEPSTAQQITHRRVFSAKKTDSHKIIFLKAVHGTWSNSGSYGADSNKILAQWFIAYAQRLALAENATVYLDAVTWDGQLSQQARENAGRDVAIELISDIATLKKSNPRATIAIHMIGHSHGCNVINFAAKYLGEHTFPIAIDSAIFFGSPQSDFFPSNIYHLLNLFGNLDFAGSMGSIVSSGGKSADLRKSNSSNQPTILKNVVLKYKGHDLNHISIKYMGLNFLPLIEKYLLDNFVDEEHLIVDIYDANEYITTALPHDEDHEDLNSTVMKDSRFTIEAIIDELYSDNACELDAYENNSDVSKSNINTQKYNERYNHPPTHQTRSYLDRLVSEIESAQAPTWVLTTLKYAQSQINYGTKQSKSWLKSIKNMINSSLSPTSVAAAQATIYTLDNFQQKINQILPTIHQEVSFKQKSIIIAELYTIILQCDDEMQEQAITIMNTALKKENQIIGNWQYNYEWIIGKTRTEPNPLWTPEEANQLNNAKHIYNLFATNPHGNIKEMLSGYEHLNLAIRQAFLSAAEQGLCRTDIETIAEDYLQKHESDYVFI